MKNKALKTFIIIFSVLICTVKAYGVAEVGQSVETDVQPAVAIKKTASKENGTINPSNGSHDGLSAAYSLQTNSTNTEFIIKSEILTKGGLQSGFGEGGRLLFGNIDNVPESSAVENARTGSGKSYNVIAYPFSASVTEPMKPDFVEDSTNGACWKIYTNNGFEGTLTQTIGTTPCSNTYEKGGDSAGTYKVTVIVTSVEK